MMMVPTPMQARWPFLLIWFVAVLFFLMSIELWRIALALMVIHVVLGR